MSRAPKFFRNVAKNVYNFLCVYSYQNRNPPQKGVEKID